MKIAERERVVLGNMAGTPKEGCKHIGSDGRCGRAVEAIKPDGEGMMSLNDLMLPIGNDLKCRVRDMSPRKQKENCVKGFEAASSEA